jgi:hypothetical protein
MVTLFSPALTISNLNGTYFPKYWSTKRFNHSLFSFAAFMFNIDWDCMSRSGDYSCYKPFAVECRLWPAIQSIRSRIDVSELQEKMVSSEPVMSYYDPDRYQLEYIWLSVSDKVLRRGRWEECYASSTYTSSEPVPISNNSLWHDYGGIVDIVPDDIVWYAEDCVWTIDKESISALQSFLFDMFNEKNLSLVYYPDAPSYGQLWIEDLYDNGTRSISTSETYVAQLARSLTVYTRLRNLTRNENFGYARGNAVETDTCIEVRWGWIAFPVILVLAFLATTIWQTRKSRRPTRQTGAWKSSSLAVLFGGLDEKERRSCGVMEKKSEMNSCTSELRVSLRPGNDGWRLGQ